MISLTGWENFIEHNDYKDQWGTIALLFDNY